MNEPDAGKIITVTGPIEPEDAGVTLLHEHVICDMRGLMAQPVTAESEARRVTLENSPEIRWDPFGTPDNYLLDDVGGAVSELAHFSAAGGSTVVDCTPSRYRDPQTLVAVSEASGVNLVMGGGHYLEKSHPDDLGRQPLEEIAAEVIEDFGKGVGDTGVRLGIIGEIGTGDPMTDAEERVLRAMAWAQLETGLAITVHVHPWGKGGHRVMDVLLEEGVGVDRIVLNHAFVDVGDPDYVDGLLARGPTLGFDMFGFDHSLFHVGRYPPTDFEAATEVARLVAAGHASRLILSQDICVKTRMKAFGGWGYAHLLENVGPMMIELGIGRADLDQMLVGNTARLLSVQK